MVKTIIPIIVILTSLLLGILYFGIKTESVVEEPIVSGIESIVIGDKTLTTIEYTALKTKLAAKVDGRKIKLLTDVEADNWKSVVDIEIKKCGTWILTDVNEKNIIDKLNEKLKSDKCI